MSSISIVLRVIIEFSLSHPAPLASIKPKNSPTGEVLMFNKNSLSNSAVNVIDPSISKTFSRFTSSSLHELNLYLVESSSGIISFSSRIVQLEPCLTSFVNGS